MTEDIGYGNPPKKAQFKKGQSGNPKGRPKRKNFNEDLLKELSAIITINENGQTSKITKQEALIKRLISEALSAKLPAMKMLLNFLPEERPPAQESRQKFVMNLGSPKVQNKIRLQKIEEERRKLLIAIKNDEEYEE